ncbi:hypothetical protein SARC_07690 [Sphaeroforma arctica JP610]|uniref:ADP-ribosylation factor-like protein 6-interacting protein 4 n=1 Tax=Sphaeroforma arctica JP610 TaxID=667725 RepID=A0A0L0FT13_9EUKA|nr:hypothetical protein SARC_07690 [Sphaeroforma arctica JP610]KNC79930.1 hypothetical protein SARC_07690 [Sphaeroforma arctica JP610]|eukprot:XP_014153832.1 hypothetical protein SARC_07690 [Sphaeroforma arctica JP610]
MGSHHHSHRRRKEQKRASSKERSRKHRARSKSKYGHKTKSDKKEHKSKRKKAKVAKAKSKPVEISAVVFDWMKKSPRNGKDTPDTLAHLSGNRFAEKYKQDLAPQDEKLVQARKTAAPMTKAMHEDLASRVVRAFDPESGRIRLMRADGEIVEEIVSKEEQRRINRAATFGDGYMYQKNAHSGV